MDSQLVVSAALAWRGFDETIESVTVLPDANARSIRQDKVIYIEHRHRMLGSVLFRYASHACEANSRGKARHFTGIGARRLQFQKGRLACASVRPSRQRLHSVPHCIVWETRSGATKR